MNVALKAALGTLPAYSLTPAELHDAFVYYVTHRKRLYIAPVFPPSDKKRTAQELADDLRVALATAQAHVLRDPETIYMQGASVSSLLVDGGSEEYHGLHPDVVSELQAQTGMLEGINVAAIKSLNKSKNKDDVAEELVYWASDKDALPPPKKKAKVTPTVVVVTSEAVGDPRKKYLRHDGSFSSLDEKVCLFLIDESGYIRTYPGNQFLAPLKVPQNGRKVKLATALAADPHRSIMKDGSKLSFGASSLCLDVYDPSTPVLYSYRCSGHANQAFRFTQVDVDDDELSIEEEVNLPIKPNLGFRVVSLNVGFNVLLNAPYGSEKPAVNRCQRTYSAGGGWVSQNLAGCALNGVKGCVAMFQDPPVVPDIVSLQEVPDDVPSVRKRFLKAFHEESGGLMQIVDTPQTTVLIYNPQTMGPAHVITVTKIKNGGDHRDLLAAWFPARQAIVVNLHAPHGPGLKKMLGKGLRKVERDFLRVTKLPRDAVETVILCGDFNDYKGSLLQPPDDWSGVFNDTLELPVDSGSSAPRTCCEDSGYSYTGDYIYMNSKALARCKHVYRVPRQYKRHNPPISDHDPVVLIPA